MFCEGYVFASLSRCRRRGTRGWRMEDAGWCSGQFLTLTRHRSLSPFPAPTCPVNFSTHPASGDHGENLPFSLIRAHYDTGLGARGDPNLNPNHGLFHYYSFILFRWGGGEWELISGCFVNFKFCVADPNGQPGSILRTEPCSHQMPETKKEETNGENWT